MKIRHKVIKDILQEEKLNGELEFGGWLIVKEDIIEEIIFDTQEQSGGYVRFGKNVPKDKRQFLRGWFHKHPIKGLSSMDVNTTEKLTRLWNECYTVVLQSNRKLLLIRTARYTGLVEDFTGVAQKYEIDLEPFEEYVI